jgi:hypothetical protein
MNSDRTMLSLGCIIAVTLPLISCGDKVKVEAGSNPGSGVSVSANTEVSSAKGGAQAECQQVYGLATKASSQAQMLGMFLPRQNMNPQIDPKIAEVKQHLAQLQTAPIHDRTVNSLRGEYISMMQTALQPVEDWSASKAEAQREQVTATFKTQLSKAIDFRMKRMFAGDCRS